ncbi:hypothetical protein A7K92_26595 [Klebsiella pneumoniae]|nr:hypothetical protein A7K92_26595 [Klebsiella pneumoniae]
MIAGQIVVGRRALMFVGRGLFALMIKLLPWGCCWGGWGGAGCGINSGALKIPETGNAFRDK